MCSSVYLKQKNNQLIQLSQKRHKECITLSQTVDTLSLEKQNYLKEINQLREEVKMLKTFYATQNQKS